VFDPPSRRPGAPPGALDEPPDPQFWGPPERPPHRRRPSRPVRLGAEARLALAAVLVVLVSATLVSYDASRQPSDTRTPPSAGPGTTVRRVIVQVAGAVTRPGVVELPVGSRVIDAVDAVGGALPAADLDHVNLAAKLRDGEQVLVTTTDPTTTTPASAGAAPPSTG
jgi:competence protein ComEA